MHKLIVRNKILFGLAGILLLTSISFQPCFNSGFTNWDDSEYVTDNPDIRTLTPGSVKKLFTRSYVSSYIPLAMLSYAVEYRLAGLSPRVFHLTNLALHLVNCLLLYRLLFLLLKRTGPALAIALLFSIHPLHVESVAWVSGRKDMLYAFFFLWCLITYCGYLRHLRVRTLVWAALLGLCAMLAKPMAASLPAVLLLLDFHFRRPVRLRALLEKIPFAAMAAGVILIALLLHRDAEAFNFGRESSLLHLLALPCKALLLYARKLLLPVSLSAIYQHPDPNAPLPAQFIYALYCVPPALGLLARACRKKRVLLTGLLFFLLTIAPVLQFVPFGQSYAADRFMYLPLLGPLIMGAAFFSGRGLHRARRLVRPAIIVIACLFGLLTWNRCAVWNNSLTFWNDVLEKNPANVEGYYNRGNALLKKGEYRRAIADYDTAVSLCPAYSKVYVNRAYAYFTLGDKQQAIADYSAALRFKPDDADAWFSRGNIFNLMGRQAAAEADFNQALRFDPDHQAALAGRGTLYRETGRANQAIADLSRALARTPEDPALLYERGMALSAAAEYGRAISDFTAALQLRVPPDKAALIGRAAARNALQQHAAAISDCNSALRADPAQGEAYYARALGWKGLGDYPRAWQDLLQAHRLGYAVPPETMQEVNDHLR